MPRHLPHPASGCFPTLRPERKKQTARFTGGLLYFRVLFNREASRLPKGTTTHRTRGTKQFWSAILQSDSPMQASLYGAMKNKGRKSFDSALRNPIDLAAACGLFRSDCQSDIALSTTHSEDIAYLAIPRPLPPFPLFLLNIRPLVSLFPALRFHCDASRHPSPPDTGSPPPEAEGSHDTRQERTETAHRPRRRFRRQDRTSRFSVQQAFDGRGYRPSVRKTGQLLRRHAHHLAHIGGR